MMRRRLRRVVTFGAVTSLYVTALGVSTPGYSHPVDEGDHRWQTSQMSWYGPGFYGRTTACGMKLTRGTVGVAHKRLKCGTLVRFRNEGLEIVVRVIDRGPYIKGREWDLTEAACYQINHCWTGAVDWTR